MQTVLIVEDEGILRKALRNKLLGSNYSVLEAQNGLEALEMLKTETPDIILLDIVMPKMDGITFLKERGKQNIALDIPVIVLSNLTDGDKIQHSLESGVHDYLVKADWSLADVLEKIQKRIGEKTKI